MSRPETSRQARIRSPIGRIGVSDSTSRSTSIFRRLRLSTMVTSWPRSDRYRAVGQPQKPSPPRTRTRIPTPISVAGGGAAGPSRDGEGGCLRRGQDDLAGGGVPPWTPRKASFAHCTAPRCWSLRGFAGRLRTRPEAVSGPVRQGPHSPAAELPPAPHRGGPDPKADRCHIALLLSVAMLHRSHWAAMRRTGGARAGQASYRSLTIVSSSGRCGPRSGSPRPGTARARSSPARR